MESNKKNSVMASALENCVYQNQQIPQSVIILSKIMPNISVTAFNQILKLIFDVVQKNTVPPKALEKLLKKLEISENGDNLFCGLLMLVNAMLRLPIEALKENDLRQSLRELKFTDECCSSFITAFHEKKVELYNSKLKSGFQFFHTLENFNWRIDITVSSNFLAKSLETVFIFQMIFENGESETFEVSIAKFQQLRFYVASMLKEMEFIEKKNVFKI